MGPVEVIDSNRPSTDASVVDCWDSKGELRPHHRLTQDDVDKIETLAVGYGCAPESYDIVLSSESVLFTPCRRGVMHVISDRNIWHIPGGILAPRSLLPQIAEWLKRTAESEGKTVALYSINSSTAAAFRAAGYEVSRFGEEPTVDLGNVTWTGRQFQWVRRQASYCQRNGVTVTEVSSTTEQRELAPRLLEILNEDLADRTYSMPLRLLEGGFDPNNLRQRRLFVATQGDVVQAFVACSPMNGGREWAFETYRQSTDAVRGVVPFLFKEIIDRMQAEHVQRVSLCLVPGKNVDQPIVDQPVGGDNALVNRALSIWYRRLNFLFNCKGLDHFKQRFRPEDHVRYVCVTPRSSIRTLISFGRVTGALRPNLRNLFQKILRSVTRRS